MNLIEQEKYEDFDPDKDIQPKKLTKAIYDKIALSEHAQKIRSDYSER